LSRTLKCVQTWDLCKPCCLKAEHHRGTLDSISMSGMARGQCGAGVTQAVVSARSSGPLLLAGPVDGKAQSPQKDLAVLNSDTHIFALPPTIQSRCKRSTASTRIAGWAVAAVLEENIRGLCWPARRVASNSWTKMVAPRAKRAAPKKMAEAGRAPSVKVSAWKHSELCLPCLGPEGCRKEKGRWEGCPNPRGEFIQHCRSHGRWRNEPGEEAADRAGRRL
jgi:hypothetical protein